MVMLAVQKMWRVLLLGQHKYRTGALLLRKNREQCKNSIQILQYSSYSGVCYQRNLAPDKMAARQVSYGICGRHFSTTPCMMFKKHNIKKKNELTEEIDVTTILQRIQNKTEMKFNIADVEGKINSLLNIERNSDMVINVFVKNPIYLQCKLKTWNNMLRTLSEFGFHDNAALNLMYTEPGLLNLKKERITDVMDTLRSFKLNEKDIQQMIVKAPDLLFQSVEQLCYSHTELSSLYHREDLRKLFVHIPQVLLDSKSAYTTFMYVYNAMFMEQSEIAKCRNLLAYPLSHVMKRHLFLLRTGFYKTPTLKTRDNSSNPKLKDIIETSDKDFVAMTGLSIWEYKAFSNMIDQDGKLMKQRMFDTELFNIQGETYFDIEDQDSMVKQMMEDARGFNEDEEED